MQSIKLTIAVLTLTILTSCATPVVPKIPIINLGIHDKESITLYAGDVECVVEGNDTCAKILMSRKVWAKTQFRYKLYRQGYESQVELIRRHNLRAK